jgi:phage gp29-like protein
MSIREKSVAGMPLRFEPGTASLSGQRTEGDVSLAEQVKEYVQDVILALPAFDETIRQMMNAVLMGGQGHEWDWQMVDGTARPVQSWPVHKSRFVFDRLGNMSLLTRNNPVWGGYVITDPQAPFPAVDSFGRKIAGDPLYPSRFSRGKFTYHQYSTGNGGTWTRTADEGYLYYGRGEDVNLFTIVTFDNFVLRFQMKWLEKFGIPLSVVNYPEGTASADQVLNICESIRGESTVRVPHPPGPPVDDWYRIDFVTPPGTGYGAFMEFHNSWTSPRIQKILLGGSDQLETGGGYAAAVSQKDFGPNMIYRYDAKKISGTLNNQLVPAIVLAKFPNLPSKLFPKIIIEPKEEIDREMQIGILNETAQAVPVRKKDFYIAAGISEPLANEEVVFLGMNPGQEAQEAAETAGPRPKKVKPGHPAKKHKPQKQPRKDGSDDEPKNESTKRPRGPIGRKTGKSVGLGKKR